MGDWIYDNFGIIFIAVLGLFFGLLYGALSSEKQRHEEFMEACMHDRQKYECTALWRAGSTQTSVVPVIVPIR
jgi:hypothetical protein